MSWTSKNVFIFVLGLGRHQRIDIMKYFTFAEMIQSQKAAILEIKNKPNEKESENLIKLVNEILDPIREKWGNVIIVTSGYRCQELNTAMKGSKSSQHIKGEAADIISKDGKNKELFELIVGMIKDGEIEVGQLLNEYNYSWIHISLPTARHKNEIKSIE